MSPFRKILIPGCLAFCALASCSGPDVKIFHRVVAGSETTRTLTSSTTLEHDNRRTLRDEELLSLYRKEPHAAITTLAARYQSNPSKKRLLALAEISSDYADSIQDDRPLVAMGKYLDAAWLTREGAYAAISEGVKNEARTIYAASSARVALLMRDHPEFFRRPMEVTGSFKTWRISVETNKGSVSPNAYDLIVPARWLKTDGIKWKSITQAGVGAAMIGHRKSTPERKELDPLIPTAGRGFPLNARVDFDGNRARLVLQDLMQDASTRYGGRNVPLDANFSAAVSFSYYDKVRRMNKFEALLRPAEYADTVGLTSFQPFDPGRIPLILVHGLMSSAEAWYPFINLLLADSVVRERYQILLFNYPTGVPISKSGEELRKALAAFQRREDPNRSNPRMSRMVIVGHSMGGIVANMQIRRSGDRLYNAVFTKDLEDLDLPDPQKELIEDYYYFEANSHIERAIFLATPHRGSAFASNKIGQLGAQLIRLPFNVLDSILGRIELVDALTDVAQQASQRPPNSVTGLRPDNPLLGALLECPVRPELTIHSVMGQKHAKDSKVEGSDGFVPYTSSHLDKAVSEVIVKNTNHRGMVIRGETVQEVWRILRLHAK